MAYISLEKLLKHKEDSLFKTVLIAAARANELAQGAQPLIKTDSKKISTIALEEMAAGKIRYEETKKSKKSNG